MPTVEELEAEIKAQRANFEGQFAAKEAELTSIKSDMEAVKAHAIGLTDKIKGYEKAERDDWEAKYHAVTKDLSEDQQKAIVARLGALDKMSNTEIQSFVGGFELAHAVAPPDPRRSHTTNDGDSAPSDTRTRAQKILDGE